MTRRQHTVAAALTGVVTAVVTLAVAEVVSLLLGGTGSPLLSVGALVIDVVPAGFKDLVIELFDTADKLVLFLVLALLVLALAVAVGILQVRRSPWGIVVLAAVAAISVVAAVTRAEATAFSAAPTVVGTVVGVLILRALVSRLENWRASAPGPSRGGAAGRPQYERRAFLLLALSAGVTAAAVGAGARMLGAAATAVRDLRAALTLPTPASTGAEITADSTLDVTGLTPFVTPNADFYRIDTALQVPSIDPTQWSLRVTGMVENEFELTWDQLTALPLDERLITLSCVSNEVGGTLVGNALWLGYPIRELLARARPTAGADMVLSRSQDGFTAGTPLEVLQDDATDALLAIGMNGEPLPLEHGFPARMVVPGLYGYVSATKWVTELKVTTFAADEAYWTPRGWSARGPIKLSSRIDVPRRGELAKAGTVAVAGVAWAPHTGIAAVDVRVDGGQWQSATLAKPVTVDSWLQWSFAWAAEPGNHEIQVRATDTAGLMQTSTEAPPAPDGSSGLHMITVRVE